ncbi:MAG: NUDIX domain-containing protein [Hyphomicrobiales bacterium]|nr:NUDIX domain-containing protein [Hyphomicrobiales bacterium]
MPFTFELPGFARRLLFRYWQVKRGMTLGVRAVIADADGRVFLIRHSYVPGWHFPGGGVEVGETVLEALSREIDEEAGIDLDGAPELFAVYHNGRHSPRDHVLLYLCRNWRTLRQPKPNAEIVDHGFFALDALPDDTAPAVRRRLDEVFSGAEIDPVW